MIDIEELRKRLFYRVDLTLEVQTIEELLNRLEAEESAALEQARLNGMGAERELALMAKLEAAKHALHQISLGSQIALSSQRECARIARVALDESK